MSVGRADGKPQHAERRLDQWAKAGVCDQLHLEVDRGKPGSKLHLVSERHGLPLTAAVTAANVNDTLLFAALLDDVPAVLIPARRRRSRPGKVIPHHARRLAVRWDRESGRWFGFVLLACALVCFKQL